MLAAQAQASTASVVGAYVLVASLVDEATTSEDAKLLVSPCTRAYMQAEALKDWGCHTEANIAMQT